MERMALLLKEDFLLDALLGRRRSPHGAFHVLLLSLLVMGAVIVLCSYLVSLYHSNSKSSMTTTAGNSSKTKSTPTTTSRNSRRPQSMRHSTMQWFKNAKSRDEVSTLPPKKWADTIQLQHSDFLGHHQDSAADLHGAPVNILVLEGGGMKGHALMGMLLGLQQVSGDDEDFLQYFDLACGTSVGGITALIMNRTGSMDSFVKEVRGVMNDTRERLFTKLQFGHLLQKGSLLSTDENMGTLLQEHYGDASLYNPAGLKVFALATTKKESTCTSDDDDGAITKDGAKNKNKQQQQVEPFLLRTYDVPDVPEDENSKVYHLKGTSNMPFWQAGAATSAAVFLSQRVEATVGGDDNTKVKLADGDIIANNPTAIAILEARCLWPHRPIGVVVALSLTDHDTPAVMEAAASAHRLFPDMHFALLRPPIKIGAASTTKLQEAEDLGTDYILESQEAAAIIEHLQASGSRWRKKRQQPNKASMRSSLANVLPQRFSTWLRGSQMPTEQLMSSSFASQRFSTTSNSSSNMNNILEKEGSSTMNTI